ncbi:hypothetical protein ACFL5Z_05090 [Planctomycetota bacterium]
MSSYFIIKFDPIRLEHRIEQGIDFPQVLYSFFEMGTMLRILLDKFFDIRLSAVQVSFNESLQRLFKSSGPIVIHLCCH